MVTLNGQKMGKSLGNAISLHQFFSGDHKLLTRSWSADVIRFFLLQSHYRSTTDFSETALEAAESGLKNLRSIVSAILDATPGKASAFDLDGFKAAIEACLNDDFNSATAIAALFEWLRPLRTAISKGESPFNLDDVKQFVRVFVDDVLGLQLESVGSDSKATTALDAVMELVLEMRATARANKDWPTADLIRNKLTAAGIRIEDGPQGSTYTLD
jgi:cysteinyl-tRNA synthetase